MTSIFEGQPRKQGLFQSKQGSFGFQVYMHQVLQYDTTTSITFSQVRKAPMTPMIATFSTWVD